MTEGLAAERAQAVAALLEERFGWGFVPSAAQVGAGSDATRLWTGES